MHYNPDPFLLLRLPTQIVPAEHVADLFLLTPHFEFVITELHCVDFRLSLPFVRIIVF